MAGNYTDPPAPRMAYDRDGTVGVHLVINSSTVQETTNSDLVRINDEDSDILNNYSWYGNVGGVTYGLAFIFPEFRDVVGYMVQCNHVGASRAELQTSTNTTNGLDGTWVTQDASWDSAGSSINYVPMRENITSVAFNGIKSMRFLTDMGTGGSRAIHYYVVHLYGTASNYAGQDTLRIWHPTLDEPLDDNTSADGAHLDWGDVVRGTTADRTFRIKNNSATLTANSVIISTQVASNTSPTLESQITYSDGGAFQPSLDIGNLAPGALSSVISVRKATDINAALSLWWLRTVAEATSWS